MLRADLPEVVIPPDQQEVPVLTAEEQKLVNTAIDRGIVFLRKRQHETGMFMDGSRDQRLFACSYASLPGLALLESGVPPGDPAIQAAAGFVRKAGSQLTQTYDIGLAILFLDRLGEARDRQLLQCLALRLAAAQNISGGWGYRCPLLTAQQELTVKTFLRQEQARAFKQVKYRDKLPATPLLTRPVAPNLAIGDIPNSGMGDNSNTQFAILALGAARRYDLPLASTMARVEQRFRSSQEMSGWAYVPKGPTKGTNPDASMTCVGLLALALGRAAEADVPKRDPAAAVPQDPGIQLGLWSLGRRLDHRAGRKLKRSSEVNVYYLWSVERVAVLCGVKTIGDTDWYRWGCGYLIPAQTPAGSWVDLGMSRDSPVVATSMALLFLKRSDLLPDVRKELARRVQIVDPGAGTQGSPGQKGKPVSTSKSPGEAEPGPKAKSPSPGVPDDKGPTGKAVANEDGRLDVDLGEVRVGQAAALLFRVRGPSAFRISAIRGGDERLKVQPDSQSATVHDLTVTFDLKEAGPFERTIYLQTDLPGRAEVAVRLRARATAPGAK
jgi:hypothetical protein